MKGTNSIAMQSGWKCRWIDLFIIEVHYVKILYCASYVEQTAKRKVNDLGSGKHAPFQNMLLQ